jgi:hypothetical protein
MKKPSAPQATPPRRPRRSRSKAQQKAVISATLANLDQIKPQTPKAVNVIGLLRSWLTDESGYDEQTWPKLKKAFTEERDRAGARRLFDE